MITKFDIHELFPNSQTINRKRDITVYHGSKKWFEEFNTKRLGENTFTDLLSLLGFHFTRNYRVAQVFGRSQILTVYLHINKTLKLTEHELVLGMIKYMLGKGYYLGDGLEDFDELSQLPYYMDGFNSTLYSRIEFSLVDKKYINDFKKNILLKNGYDSIEYLNQIETTGKGKRYDFITLIPDVIEVDLNRIKRF